MNSFTWYKGVLKFYEDPRNCKKISNVLVMFTNKLDMKSMFIFMPDEQDEYSSLIIYANNDQRQIITGHEYKKLTREKKRKCEMFDDAHNYFLIDFEEDIRHGV